MHIRSRPEPPTIDVGGRTNAALWPIGSRPMILLPLEVAITAMRSGVGIPFSVQGLQTLRCIPRAYVSMAFRGRNTGIQLSNVRTLIRCRVPSVSRLTGHWHRSFRVRSAHGRPPIASRRCLGARTEFLRRVVIALKFLGRPIIPASSRDVWQPLRPL
jgi:hypothetical protein